MSEETLFRTIGEQIAHHIRRDVLSGELKAGDRLREVVLAKRFGVSRGPIRDALLQLTQEGVLLAVPNRGVTVNSRTSEHLQPLVVGLRRQIEEFALREGMAKFDEVSIQRLSSMAERMRYDFDQGNTKALAEHDMAFHRQLVAMAGEEDLVNLWVPIVVRMFLHYTRYKDPMQVYNEHIAIVEAIKQKDLDAALAALETNIQ